MTTRIAISSFSLQDACPRGIPRVTRAFADRLATREGWETLCLEKRVSGQWELVFEAQEMGRWLAHHPLRYVPRFLRTKRVVSALCPPVLRPLGRRTRSLVGRVRALRHQGKVDAGESTQYVHLDHLDAVLVFDPYDPIWYQPLEMTPARLIGWFHDAIPLRINQGADMNPDQYQAAVSRMCLRASKIVCVSESARHDLLSLFACPPEKTRVIYNGHDADRFRMPGDEVARNRVLSRYGIEPSIPYLVTVGTVEPRKNIANILRAAHHLRDTSPDLTFQLVIVGDLRGAAQFGPLFRDTGRVVRLIRTGYVADADVAALASGAAAFLYPSLWEGFGIPMLEAMSAGVPVVAASVSSMPEVCGPHAIYCDPYDPATIADAVRCCLTMSPAERQRRTTEARAHAAQYTWERAVAVLEEMLACELGISSAV